MSERPLTFVVACADPVRAAAVASALEQRGHTALATCEADEVLLLPTPDVLVVATELAGGGLELLEKLRSRGGAPPSLVLAERPTPDAFRRAMQLGARDLLTWPCAPSEVARCAERAVATTDSGAELVRAYDATPASTDRACRDLCAWLLRRNITPATRCRVVSAVAEALDNVARHAYSGGVGPAELYARLEGRELVVVVRDHGAGFDTVDVGLEHLDDSSLGGLARMCALSEDLSFDGRSGGVRVRLRFSVYRTRFDEDGGEDLTELDYLTPALAQAVLTNLNTDGGGDPLHLSPALAVSVGRLLAGPDPRRVLETTLWS